MLLRAVGVCWGRAVGDCGGRAFGFARLTLVGLLGAGVLLLVCSGRAVGVCWSCCWGFAGVAAVLVLVCTDGFTPSYLFLAALFSLCGLSYFPLCEAWY